MLIYVWALLCVMGMAAGQIIFKLAANSLAKTGSFFVPQTFTLLLSALALYGLITIAWIWVLQRADLGKTYPMMALAFVLVPLASHWLFGERFTPQYFIGIALIIGGIVVAVRS
ncbi:MAG: 4-amino-4-deoxy-L-arabinose-phospho-UDP flippase [Lautropia sp.]|nr:4-amino-4-deoxy-L-arabinose-phospho-UDP flippase [Lautropia sp.]